VDCSNKHTASISTCFLVLPVTFPFDDSREQHSFSFGCHFFCRLQNSLYFCVFKYARAVKQKVWNEAENSERDWGETLKIRFLFSCLTPLACEARALRARKTLTPQFTFFLLILRKNRLFCSLRGHAPSRLASGEELMTSVAQKEKSKTSKGICMEGYSEKYHFLQFLYIHN